MASDMDLLRAFVVLVAIVVSPFLVIATISASVFLGTHFLDAWRRTH